MYTFIYKLPTTASHSAVHKAFQGQGPLATYKDKHDLILL